MIWNPTQLYALKLVLLCFLRLSTWALLKRVCHRSASALIKWAARTPHCAVSFHGSTGKKSGRENWQAKASWDTSIPYVICLQTSTHICIFVIYNIIYIIYIYIHWNIFTYQISLSTEKSEYITNPDSPLKKKRRKLPLYIKLPVEEKSVASHVMSSWEASSLPFGVLNGRCTFLGAYTISIMYIYRLSYRHIDIYITSNKTTIMRIGFQ